MKGGPGRILAALQPSCTPRVGPARGCAVSAEVHPHPKESSRSPLAPAPASCPFALAWTSAPPRWMGADGAGPDPSPEARPGFFLRFRALWGHVPEPLPHPAAGTGCGTSAGLRAAPGCHVATGEEMNEAPLGNLPPRCLSLPLGKPGPARLPLSGVWRSWA